MKNKVLLAVQLFFISYLSATFQPTISQLKDYAENTVWAFEENKGQVMEQALRMLLEYMVWEQAKSNGFKNVSVSNTNYGIEAVFTK